MPELYPVVAAAVRALEHPILNTLGVLTTTGSAAFAVWINGPLAQRLGFNSGANLLGPGNRSNATVGRALSLVTRILAGARQGLGDMATMGQPAKYTLAFAENEAESPWTPFHVDRGFSESESTVTVAAISGTAEVVNPWAVGANEIIESLGHALASQLVPTVYADGTLGGGPPVLLLSPEWAGRLAAAGLSKQGVRNQLHKAATRSRESLPPSYLRGVEGSGAPIPAIFKVAATPDDILVVVAGGVGLKQALMPSWNGRSRAVTTPVELRTVVSGL